MTERPDTEAEGFFSNNQRANDILNVIMAYARLDWSRKIHLSDKNDVFDGIGAGVNMLGEELKSSTISLKEKEQLLKEIHHRVKNNLQIVSSLLNLQSQNILDERYLSLIRDSRNRIHSMALVHEMLYASSHFGEVSAKEYITRLAASIHHSLAPTASRITFAIEIEPDIFFEIDRIIPIGLIVNEIISNSFKHAFASNMKGKISVKLRKKNNACLLTISDSGPGFPSGFEMKKDGNLGIQLIQMLCEQLDTVPSVAGERGVKYNVSFPNPSRQAAL